VKSALGFVPTFLAAKASLGHKLLQVLSTDFMNDFSGRDAYQEMLSGIDTVTQLKGRHVVNQSSYLWSKLALTNYILRTLGDGMEMAHSIEGRVPFLDHKLVEFLAKVPMRLKIKNGVEKYILRQAAKPMLTDTIYKRQKHSFMAPPLSIFADPKARDHVRQIFVNHDFSTRTFFESKKMVSLIDKFDDMTAQQLTAIEPIIMMGLTSYFLAKAYQLNS
jgi:asparagine synthase (glutamine-hydrolysing)